MEQGPVDKDREPEEAAEAVVVPVVEDEWAVRWLQARAEHVSARNAEQRKRMEQDSHAVR